MKVEILFEEDGVVSVLPIHFDVPSHHVPLSFFVATAQDAAVIAAEINKYVFGEQLSYQLVVLPPDSGTFLSRIAVKVKWVGAGLLATTFALETDVAKGFVEGLTGKTPYEWAKQFGELLTEPLSTAVAEDEHVEFVDPKSEAATAALVITECTKSFLEARPHRLGEINITPENFRAGHSAKNDFYQQCLAQPQLRGISFSEGDKFPIDRSDFPHLLTSIPPEEDEVEVWRVEIRKLKVTSPNWDHLDRQRLWKARDESGRDRYFRIEDEEFWSHAQLNELRPTIVDTMIVQWAFREANGKTKEFRVLRVLEFNSQKLSEPLPDHALTAVLGKFSEFSSKIDQFDLFSDDG